MFTVLTGNVAKNSNIFEITDNVIDDNSIIEVYPSDESIIPVEVSVTGNTLVVTFDSKAANIIPIKIFVNNLVGEYLPPSSGDAYDIDWKEMPETGMQSVGDGLDKLVDYFNGLEEEVYTKVPDDTVLGGVLYNSTTGNTWKKLTASNIDYDENSTIYSAMGDIDELETESTNLVDAINEVNAKPSGGVNYSTDEHIVGTWIDGTPVYERTFYITEFSGQLWQANQWYEVTSIDGTVIRSPLSAEMIWLETGYDGVTKKAAVNYMVSVSNNVAAFHNHIALLFYRPNTAMNNIYLTLRYIK